MESVGTWYWYGGFTVLVILATIVYLLVLGSKKSEKVSFRQALVWSNEINSAGGLSEGKALIISDSRMNSAAFLSDTLIISASPAKGLQLWNVQTGKEVARTTGHQSPVNCVAFSPDGATLASGADDGSIILWDAGEGKELGRMAGSTGVIESLTFNSGGTELRPPGSKMARFVSGM